MMADTLPQVEGNVLQGGMLAEGDRHPAGAYEHISRRGMARGGAPQAGRQGASRAVQAQLRSKPELPQERRGGRYRFEFPQRLERGHRTGRPGSDMDDPAR